MRPFITFGVLASLAGCAGCRDPKLKQLEECQIEANHQRPEICNGVDDNCSNSIDEGCDDDGDGFCDAAMAVEAGSTCAHGGGDCADDDPAAHPGATEVCNGKDDDCDARTDLSDMGLDDPRLGQSCGQETMRPDKVGVGVCKLGTTSCQSGAVTCEGTVQPSAETCDGKDNDCNGLTDDGSNLFELCQSIDNPVLLGECLPGVYRCVGGRMDRDHCIGEAKPSAEICDTKDNNCDGNTDEGCGVSVACPADTTVIVGTPVTLTANAVTQSGTITYAWTVVSGPPGGIGTPNQWDPDPPTAATEIFTPSIVGVYTIRVAVANTNGATATCETHVTATGFGLHVELTWDGSADLDLHLHNGASTPWFSTPGKSDCYYAEKTPDWDVAGFLPDDPKLDIDNVMADGPENIIIPAPVAGEAYTIGVHNYSRGDGRIATIRIFCGTATVPQATYVSRAFTGTSGGQCTSNDFWKPATVTFNAAGACTITFIDSWSTGTSRCQSF